MIFGLIGLVGGMDVFVVVFCLFNMFCCFFVEGVFNVVFVLMFFKKYEVGDEVIKFVIDVFNGLVFVVLSFIVLVMIFMLVLVWVMVEGFYGDLCFDVIVGYGWIVFFYIVFMLLVVLFFGVLNVMGCFVVVVVVLVLFNIFVVMVMVLVYVLG